MLEKRTWHEEVEELHAIASEEPEVFSDMEEDDEPFVSLSASKNSTQQLAALRPVNLDEEREKEYLKFFYPSNDKSYLLPLFEDLADVTFRLNVFFGFMRSLLVDGRRIFQLENDSEALKARIEQLLDATIRNDIETGNPTEDATSFLRAFMEGSFHNVLRSDVYTNGVDVSLSGGATQDNAPNYMFGYRASATANLANSTNGGSSYYGSRNANNERMEAWSTKTGLSVIKAAREIVEFLFESSSISAKLKRRVLPITTDFEEIERIFTRVTGIEISKPIIRNIGFSQASVDQFVAVELLRFPSETVRSTANVENLEEGGLVGEGLVNARLNDINRVVPEAELLNGKIRSTLRFTFEEDIARFISQSTEDKNISLYSFNNWFTIWSRQFLRAKGARHKKKKGEVASSAAGSISVGDIPRYVLPISAIPAVTAARKVDGLTTENNRTNPEGLFLAPDGTLEYRPDVSVRDKIELAKNYEALCEELYELCSQNNVNVREFCEAYSSRAYWHYISNEEYERMSFLAKELGNYDGVTLSWDWDYGTVCAASSIPGIVNTRVEVGAKRPDNLAIADYLGMNLASEGATPVQKDFASAMYLMTTDITTIGDVASYSGSKFGAEHDPAAFATSKSSPINDILTFYFQNVFVDKRFMTVQELCSKAMRNLNYTELPTEGRDRNALYRRYVTNDGAPTSAYGQSHTAAATFVQGLLSEVMRECSGGGGTEIYRQVWAEQGGTHISGREFQELVKDHPDYFNPSSSPMHEFGKLYSYFGGQVFKLILDQINNLTAEELTTAKQGRLTYGVPNMYGGGERMVEMRRLTNSDVFRTVKPIAVMLGHYVPNKDNIFAQAKAQMESIGRNESFSADDLKVPGLQADRAVFPHQLDTQAYLRKKEPPPFAVLAISPGGGKTGIGAMDMAALAGELLDLGVRVRPLVIAPDNLIKTWCDDIKYFLGANWNAVPLSTKVMERWGAERLQELADNAPANTIFVTGMDFMRGGRQNVVIGTSTVKISGNQEFIKRLAPNYIIIDESHKLKNGAGLRHKIVKAVTTATFVKWLRIASGTLMPNTPKDLEAQVALYSPHIFRTGELSELKNEDAEKENMKLGKSNVPTWQAGTPSRARDKLGRYAAVVYKKRKEWAWMLPSPIENFHGISLVDENANGEELRDQELHEQLYAAVLKITEDGIEELIAKAKEVAKRRGEDGSKLDEEGGSAEDLEEELPEGIDMQAFKEFLARFERLIIAPEFDPLYKNIFGEGKRYTSRKAKYIANLAVRHFHPATWSKEGTAEARDKDGKVVHRSYHEYDLVQYKGDWYLARKFDQTTDRFVPLPDESIGIPPDQNPEVWKKEPHGKLIIITRYNNSARAIYGALPPEYQKQATLFTGDAEDDKWKGFEAFKTDPRVNILIANEQGMSEGHNLQMASRIIRAESPWGPGELDQTSARIFRPDPKGAAEGELYRDVVYLDWVLADGTMEVAKQARVISKVFATTRIEESENELYKKVFSTYNVPTHEEVPELGMGVQALRSRSHLGDEPYSGMRRAYSALNGVVRREFHDMRVNGEAGMIPIEKQPNLPGSAIINTPFVANQDIPDPHNWKPMSIERFLNGNEEVAENFDLLKGRAVVTDFGTGLIVGVTRKKKPSVGLSSVKVKLKNPPPGVDEVLTFPLGVVFTPTAKISSADYSEFFDMSMAYTQKDLKEEQKKEEQLREQEEQEARDKEMKRKREEAEARDRIRAKDAGDKRKQNLKENKPINQGVVFDENADKKIRTGVKAVVTGDTSLQVHPAYFHGYLTLEGEFAADANVNLKKLGFKESGEYVFVRVKRYNQLASIFDYLEEHFELSKQTEDRLNDVQDAFAPGKRGLYKMELATPASLPMFFATRKRIVTNRKEVRVYPIFMHDELMLAIDLATSPAIRKHIGQSIPGANAKWQLSSGHWHFFAQGKTDVKNKITEIKKNGYKITNEKEAIKELAEINFRKARTPSK